MEDPLKNRPAEPNELAVLKHDVRNQLSNIQLALEELRYEIVDPSADTIVYLRYDRQLLYQHKCAVKGAGMNAFQRKKNDLTLRFTATHLEKLLIFTIFTTERAIIIDFLRFFRLF